MKELPPIGTEISFTHHGQSKRGWVVACEPAEVGCYPDSGDQTETFSWPLENVVILDPQETPSGWEAVSLTNESNQPWIDLRLTTEFMDRLRSDAQQAGVELSEMFALYLKQGLESASPKQD